ncbi:MAG: tetratricopeptide repeat protein [Cyclobacteriaceae bacterium]
MKNILTLLITFSLLFSLTANVNAQGNSSPEYIRQLNIYKKAKYFNDPFAAKQALYNMIELDPSNAALLDSLAYEYYAFRQYTSSLIVTLEALKRNSNNLSMMELKAINWEQIGDNSKALDSYEKLFLKNNSILTLYKIAFLQLDMKNFAQAKNSSDILMGRKEAETEKITYTKQDNTTQEISMKAAIYNLKGLIAQDRGNKEEARNHFNEALKLEPEFEVVQNNLKTLSEG